MTKAPPPGAKLTVQVAVTVAVDSSGWLWVGGASDSTDPWHGPGVPIRTHWVDSFGALDPFAGQAPASMPPVLSTCPLSLYEVVVPLIVTSTTGLMKS